MMDAMSSLPNGVRFRVKGKVVVRRIGEDSLLVPVSGSAAGARVYPVNVSALSIWNCLVGGCSVQMAAEKLVETYGISAMVALSDSRECAGRFVLEGLLEEQECR